MDPTAGFEGPEPLDPDLEPPDDQLSEPGQVPDPTAAAAADDGPEPPPQE